MPSKPTTRELDATLARVAHAADLASEQRLKLALRLSRAKARQLERENARLSGLAATIASEREDLDIRIDDTRKAARGIEADIGLTAEVREPLVLDLDEVTAETRARLVCTRGAGKAAGKPAAKSPTTTAGRATRGKAGRKPSTRARPAQKKTGRKSAAGKRKSTRAKASRGKSTRTKSARKKKGAARKKSGRGKARNRGR